MINPMIEPKYWEELLCPSALPGKLEKTIAILVLIKQAIVKRFQVVAFLGRMSFAERLFGRKRILVL